MKKRTTKTIKKTVKYELDRANPPALTKKQRAGIEALKARPDNETNTTDIPELPEEYWKNAIRRRFYKPTKTLTTVRIDSDILEWLKQPGPGYQTRLNNILRHVMAHAIHVSKHRHR